MFQRAAFLLLGFGLLVAITHADETQESSGAKLEDLAWLTGHWESRIDAVETEEHWIAPRGGLMLGVNRTVRDSGKTSFEFLRIAESDGKIIYYGSPGGKALTPFTLVKAAKDEVIFENLMHDFPQRILYKRSGEKLTARVEGKIDGHDQAEEWTWKRVDE